MKTRWLASAGVAVFFAFVIYSCTDHAPELSPRPVSLDLSQSGNLPPAAALGRVLFYDTRLSVNNSISCASCHKQGLGFSDNKQFSQGFENKPTSRNALAIQDLAGGFFGPFGGNALFWDGREANLGAMVLQPIVNHVEMGMQDVGALVERVRGTSYYKPLFEEAYGPGSEINAESIADALADFVAGLRAVHSRFDQANQGKAVLSALEKKGEDLFFGKYNCGGCHALQIGGYGGTLTRFANIGLDAVYDDPGRMNVTSDPADAGKFKVPGLRNVAVSGPYMHDGRFAKLEEVLDHYSHGIANHPNLDSLLRDGQGQALTLNISASDKDALIAFLHTLTDYTMLSDPQLSNPFKQ
jgi:cytochrome c peroxidase